MARTNWTLDEIVMPADINSMGVEINNKKNIEDYETGTNGLLKDVSGKDIRTINKSGRYRGINCINAPATGMYFYFFIDVHNDTNKSITAKRVSSDSMYVCTCNSGTWTAWSKMYSEADKPSADELQVLGRKATITEIDKWRTLRTAGIYKVQLSSASGWFNPDLGQPDPEFRGYGILVVLNASNADNENRTIQIYYPHYDANDTTHKQYPIYRTYNGNAEVQGKWQPLIAGLHPNNIGATALESGFGTAVDNKLVGDLNAVPNITCCRYVTQGCINTPPGETSGLLFQICFGPKYSYQLYTSMGSGRTWNRSQNASTGVWTEWKKLYDSVNMPSLEELGFNNNRVVNSIDLNDLVGAGFQGVCNNNCTNQPTDGYYYIYNIHYSNASGALLKDRNIKQFAIEYNGPRMFCRYRYSGAWKPWAQIFNSESGIGGSSINQSSEYRLVTDNEKNTWNSKAPGDFGIGGKAKRLDTNARLDSIQKSGIYTSSTAPDKPVWCEHSWVYCWHINHDSLQSAEVQSSWCSQLVWSFDNPSNMYIRTKSDKGGTVGSTWNKWQRVTPPESTYGKFSLEDTNSVSINEAKSTGFILRGHVVHVTMALENIGSGIKVGEDNTLAKLPGWGDMFGSSYTPLTTTVISGWAADSITAVEEIVQVVITDYGVVFVRDAKGAKFPKDKSFYKLGFSGVYESRYSEETIEWQS